MTQHTDTQLKENNFAADLSFSSSFVNDLENNPNFGHALDKLEQDLRRSNNHKTGTCDNYIQVKQTDKQKFTSSVVSENTAVCRNGGQTSRLSSLGDNAGNLQTPARSKGQGQPNSSASFCDLSFASPIDISTPQIFKSSRHNSTKQGGISSTSRKVSKQSPSSVASVKPVKTPQSTPRRSQRLSTKKKRVLDGLEFNISDTNSEAHQQVTNKTEDKANSTKQNKSDFFKSLLAGDDSLNETKAVTKLNSREPALTTKEDQHLDIDVHSTDGNTDTKENNGNIEKKDNSGVTRLTNGDTDDVKDTVNSIHNKTADVSMATINTSRRIQPCK